MAYGYIQTASNVARQLKELNRDYRARKTWENLYGTIDIQRQDALSDLEYDYEGQVAKAYSAAYNEKSRIANSALGTGFKEQAENNIDVALQEAFASYKRNYLNSAENINSSALEMTTALDETLNQEAQNYVDYEASTYSYLQYLYNQAVPPLDADYEANNELATMFNDDPNWSKFVVTEKDAEGVETKRLMTEQELRARNYDLDEKGQGTLNKTGVDFYDQMLNGLSQEGSDYGFHAWLSKENPELYEWSVSGDDYNFTEAGTKMGSFKKMMGLQSTDDEYKFIERFGGIAQDEVKAKVESFVSELEGFENLGEMKDSKEAIKVYSNALSNLTDYVHKLNLTDEQSAPITEAITKMQNYISNIDLHNTSNSTLIADVAEVIEDTWEDAVSEFEQGRLVPAVGYTLMVPINAILVFGNNILETLFPKTDKAIHNLASKLGHGDYFQTQGGRAQARKDENATAISNLEKMYLDIMTLLASYAN